jgi:hypothetical protein
MPVARSDSGDTRVIAHLDLDCFYVQGDLFGLVLNALVKLLELMLWLGLWFGFVPVVDLDCCSSYGLLLFIWIAALHMDCCSSYGLLLFTTDDDNSTQSLCNIEVILFCGKCFKVIVKSSLFSLFACGLEKSNLRGNMCTHG